MKLNKTVLTICLLTKFVAKQLSGNSLQIQIDLLQIQVMSKP